MNVCERKGHAAPVDGVDAANLFVERRERHFPSDLLTAQISTAQGQ
jgi:hypothetical protein